MPAAEQRELRWRRTSTKRAEPSRAGARRKLARLDACFQDPLAARFYTRRVAKHLTAPDHSAVPLCRNHHLAYSGSRPARGAKSRGRKVRILIQRRKIQKVCEIGS